MHDYPHNFIQFLIVATSNNRLEWKFEFTFKGMFDIAQTYALVVFLRKNVSAVSHLLRMPPSSDSTSLDGSWSE